MNNKLIISAIVILIILSVSVFLWFSYKTDAEAISNIKVTLDDITLKDINLTSFFFPVPDDIIKKIKRENFKLKICENCSHVFQSEIKIDLIVSELKYCCLKKSFASAIIFPSQLFLR